jgi:tRNA A-37 threonylcarbamoyl transferase component Bud32
MTAESSIQDALPEIRGYRLLRVIGHGGMSTVYLAEQESLGRKVAVKVMLPEALADEVSRRRFENEARTIARLDHPNIVGIYEVGRTTEALPYYAMPYLARGHLGLRIGKQEGRTKDQARVIATLRALLAALDYAHVRGVVHRDVKAENVLFDDAERPLLADFGIALRKGISPRVTMAGLAVGSTAYMPPEQARGEEVDSRADLYSIGVLAWEMLTGELPFQAGDALSMAVMHAQDPIPRLPIELRHWQRFIDKALAKVPANRFRSAHQMLEALDRLERGGFSPGALLGTSAAVLRRARALPVGAWIGIGLVGAALLGLGLRKPDGGDSDFFRVATEQAAAAPTTTNDEAIESMLRPPPESPAQRWINDTERQLAARNLTSPKNANAYDSVLAAWRADPGHDRMGATLAAVIGALGEAMGQQLRSGDVARAREYLDRATRLAAQTAPLGNAALASLHDTAAKALRARVDAAEKDMDRKDALAAASLASEFAGDKALADKLRARADKIAQPGQSVAGDRAGVAIMQGSRGPFAAMRREVTRAEYARFASATGRPPALCRERLSVLRIMKPRTWRAPGFEQGDGQSVVCVSWTDANAYAQWFSRTSGHRYRLPSATEWPAIKGEGSGRAVAEWLHERSVAGASWRGAASKRALDTNRGYDDVGFRLVREL